MDESDGGDLVSTRATSLTSGARPGRPSVRKERRRLVPRLRYSRRGTRPFHAESAWGAVLGAELFVQLRDAYRGGQPFPAGLDRDRVQAGISRRLTHALTLEPSYILQFVNAPTPLPNRREHVIQLQATHRF